MELNSSLLTYATAYKLTALLLALLAIMSFLQFLRRCETNNIMITSYHVIPCLQCCYTWIVTSSSVHNYWKCYINVVTWMCLGLYWYIRTLPWHCASSRVVHIYHSNPCCCVTICDRAYKNRPCEHKLHRVIFSLMSFVPNALSHFRNMHKIAH